MFQSTNFESYWKREEQIGKFQLYPKNLDTEVFFLWHNSRDNYGVNHREIGINLSNAGERDYIHAKAFYFVPRIT